MEWRNARQIAYLLSILLLAAAGTMLLPFALAIADGGADRRAFAYSIAISVGIAVFGLAAFRSPKKELARREAFAIVGLGWVVASLAGALPFYFSGAVPGYLDAWFECVSGFTTTGSTVIPDVEILPRGILLWRSFTQWLGGMGIIVLAMALLPALGVGGMQLYRAEMPGPEPDRLRPRIRETAKALWLVYVGISAAEVLFLWIGPMDWFDAVCHSFTTMATGGYSTRNASIAAFDSAYVDWVIVFFMVLAGTNFALHFFALTGTPQRYLKDPELRFYVALLFVFTAGLTILLQTSMGDSAGTAVRESAFQVVSIMTTTGYTTADYELWPIAGQLLLLGLMFLGGCAGSTAGSIKQVRIQLLLKRGYREVFRLVHPRALSPVRLGDRPIPSDVLQGVAGYVVLFLLIYAVAVLTVASFGLDLETAISSVAATLGNVGPGLGEVGPLDTFQPLPGAVKVILTICMLLGRLEIYALLLLFTPAYWRR
ncbi:MAG: TrkH family potassium uptake protein [Actinobacteria bacterium]|nr:TrkH family potassium uptake protein [Actinomycetota bacterium]